MAGPAVLDRNGRPIAHLTRLVGQMSDGALTARAEISGRAHPVYARPGWKARLTWLLEASHPRSRRFSLEVTIDSVDGNQIRMSGHGLPAQHEQAYQGRMEGS